MGTSVFAFSEPPGSILTAESPLFIQPSITAIGLIYRVLGGTCVVENKNTEDQVLLATNYFFSDLRQNHSASLDFLEDLEEDLGYSDFERLVMLPKHRANTKFFATFLDELTASVYWEQKNQHTASFVHLYRAYEYLSYAFPMIYAARTDSFLGTFENLKKWLRSSGEETNVGELKFHKSFVTTLFRNLPELASTIDINIVAREEYKQQIFDSLCKKVLGWKTETDYTAQTTIPDKICVPFADYHSFVVNLRNRYFHYSNSHNENLSLVDVVDSELIFSITNRASIGFVATLLNGIAKHQYDG